LDIILALKFFNFYMKIAHMCTTFVSSFLHIYDTPYDHRNNQWRIDKFRQIAETGIPIALFISPQFEQVIADLAYPNVKVLRVLGIKETKIWKLWEGKPLPNARQPIKDTMEYICLMNSKIEFIEDAIRVNPWKSSHFAWIDFNITHVFNEPKNTCEFIRFLGNCKLNHSFLAIPGCWGAHWYVNEAQVDGLIAHHICWRYCGGFFMGDTESLLDFSGRVWNAVGKLTPTWEVNVWAYCECVDNGWGVHWYPADHNDSMVCHIPIENYSVSLGIPVNSFWNSTVEYPKIPTYEPTAIAYSCDKGRHFINIRYVNYWLTPQGAYHYPDGQGIIRNINMFCELVINDEGILVPKAGGFTKMVEDIGLEQKVAFSQGLEDIRLWKDANDSVKFIATSVGYSPSGHSRMIVGDYDYDTFTMKGGQLIQPPEETVCEKNWIPLPRGEQFIYGWSPYQVGQVIDGKLAIVKKEKLSSPVYKKVRGSTTFHRIGSALGQEWGDKYLGIVHFSHGDSPRHYYHMFVVLDSGGVNPVRHSQPFHFYGERGIEFCIGFAMIGDLYHCWVSKFDRDPQLFVMGKEKVESLFV
jgi:hypothetical protein